MPTTFRTLFLGATAVLALGGCAASSGELQSITAGKTGCPASSITISDTKVTASTQSWTATCQGKTYQCSGDDMLRGTSCAASH